MREVSKQAAALKKMEDGPVKDFMTEAFTEAQKAAEPLVEAANKLAEEYKEARLRRQAEVFQLAKTLFDHLIEMQEEGETELLKATLVKAQGSLHFDTSGFAFHAPSPLRAAFSPPAI